MKKVPILIVVLLSIVIRNKVEAQIVNHSQQKVSNFFHTTIDWWVNEEGDSLIGFSLRNINQKGITNWKSDLITNFYTVDNYVYSLKCDFPLFVLKNSKQIWCSAVFLKRSGNGFDKNDTVKNEYGGVVLSNIKLLLKSTPEGAETFLIPNRIWLDKFQDPSWEKKSFIMEQFRVTTKPTTTNYANIDETVYVVVYKMNNRYKKVIYFTKPASVEKEQVVWIKF
jgi:hypothetical protein